jgi:integrase
MPKGQRGTRGAGSIQKLANGKYKAVVVVGYDKDGKMKRKTFTSDDKKEVQRKLHEFNHKKDTKSLLLSSRCSLAAYIEHYKPMKQNEVKQGTYEDYISIIDNHILSSLGHYPIENINAPLLDDYFTAKGKQLSGGSVLKHKAILSDIFKHAKREKMLSSNPIEDCIVSPKPAPRRDMIYSDDQLEALLAKADEWNNTIHRHGTDKLIGYFIRTALATAARLGEVLAINWKDINPTEHTISINKTLSEVKGGLTYTDPKTYASNGVIAVSPKLLELLDDLKDDTNSDHVFHTKTGNYFSPSNVERSWRKLLAASGLPEGYHIHDFRHTQITKAIVNGANIADVSRHARHADVRTTINMYYATDKDKDKEIAAMADKWLQIAPSAYQVHNTK